MFEALKRELASSAALSLALPNKIPVDPAEFYQSFGYLTHPFTRRAVLQLAPYQIAIWESLLKYKRVLVIKSQKVGISTSQLLADFQLSILPASHPLSCRGYDQLLLAQTRQHAQEHLRTIRKQIIKSERYRGFLIDRPLDPEGGEERMFSIKNVLRDEQSKSSVLFIRNPDDERKPSRIISLGIDNSGSLQSWKDIKHIHLSDPTAAIGDISDSINYAISRLANTRGSVVIETPPSPPKGPIYDLWKQYAGIGEPKEGQFKVFEVPASDAVKEGVITQEFLDTEKARDPVNFERLYMAKFSAHFGNVFSSANIEYAMELGRMMEEKYGMNPRTSTEKSMGIDEGFGSSNFGICVVQQIDGVLQVLLAEEHERPDINTELYDAAARIRSWPIQTCQCDAAQPAFIAALKRNVGERADYENQDKSTVMRMKIKPIAFSANHKSMLGNAVILMDKRRVAISPKFDKLLTALRTAIALDYSLDKGQTMHDDLLDAFRLALEPYSIASKEVRRS